MKDYVEFAKIELEALSKSQDDFIKKYNTDSYAKWFYDQECELLRLYNEDGDEVFFKYIPIGTYSLKSNTWMWSWENESSIEASKNETLSVKRFGEENDFEYLVRGLFECDVNECWKLTAISKKFIQSIGAYRTTSDDLVKYILLVKQFNDPDANEVRKLKQKTVDCGIHGFRRPAFVCQHLNLEVPKGFEESFETYNGMDLEVGDDFSAWCNQCELVRVEKDGWNEESEKFAKVKLVCEECYFELKEFNKIK